MSVIFTSEITGGQCGIGRLCNFKTREWFAQYIKRTGYDANTQPEHLGYLSPDTMTNYKTHKGGTGLFGTGFVPTALCQEVYEELCKKFRMVFITPVRKNKNSDNQFFYAMFDDAENEDISYISPPPWPFTDEEMSHGVA